MRTSSPVLIGSVLVLAGLLSGCSGNDHNPAGIVNSWIESVENRDDGDGHKAVQSACKAAEGYNKFDQSAKEKFNGMLDSITDRYQDDDSTVKAIDGLRQAAEINGSVTEAAGEGFNYVCESTQ